MIDIKIENETSRLKAVILGIAHSNGPTPEIEQAYDPKSIEHILAGTYPKESDMIVEMDAFKRVLDKYSVEVYRPELIENCNQIFTRDIGFVIQDKFIKGNILPDRAVEYEAIKYIVKQISHLNFVEPSEDIHIEGGDVILWNKYIFIGTYKGADYSDQKTARTNIKGVEFIRELFPNKLVREFDLIKSKTQARDNALHLDCCFQPVGNDKGIIYRGGFTDQRDYEFLLELFGVDNLFHISRDEMYHMYSNIFSIAPDVVVSENNFTRLNNWLTERGIKVETVDYLEISKQEGLLRCSTLPLYRE